MLESQIKMSLELAAVCLRIGKPRDGCGYLRNALADLNRLPAGPYRTHARSKAMRALNFARQAARS